jgi:hypothetical protein
MRRNGLRSPLWAGSQFKLIPGASNSRGRRLQPLHLGSHTSLRCSNDKICQLRVRHSSGAGNQMSEISCASYGEASWFPRELDLPSVFVEPAPRFPLPKTYVPIWPCNLRTREPPDPGFDWPFGDCVLNTSAWNSMTAAFVPVFVADGNNRHVLPESEAARFKIVFRKDRELSLVRSWDECRMRMRRARRADGFSNGKNCHWCLRYRFLD